MEPATAAAAMQIGSSIIGGLGKSSSSKKAMQSWLTQFNLQKEWEKEKMKSAHQWEVQDLIAAGLNPVLSAGGSGAMNASAPNPSLPDYSTYENAKTQKITAAINMMNAYTQAKAQSSQADLNEATKLKTEQEAGMIEPKAMAEIKHLNSAAAVNKAQKNLVESETTKTGAETEKTREETKRTKSGWLAQILGTDETQKKGKAFALGAASLFGGGTAIKAYKTFKALKNTVGFSKFLKSM